MDICPHANGIAARIKQNQVSTSIGIGRGPRTSGAATHSYTQSENRTLDEEGNTIDFYLSPTRNAKAANASSARLWTV
jgi:hypothetical protein